MIPDNTWGHTDVDGRPLHVGDAVYISLNHNHGHPYNIFATIVSFDIKYVNVTSDDGELKAFGKYPYNVKLVVPPELQVDIGL